jgi:antitoxin CptB
MLLFHELDDVGDIRLSVGRPRQHAIEDLLDLLFRHVAIISRLGSVCSIREFYTATPLTSARFGLISAPPGPSGLSAFEAAVTGITRSSEGLDARRRRLLYRAWHRGTREMDLIMGRFADAQIAALTEAELDDFERLSEQPEPDIYAWITGERPVPTEHDTAVFRRLRGFTRDGGKEREERT